LREKEDALDLISVSHESPSDEIDENEPQSGWHNEPKIAIGSGIVVRNSLPKDRICLVYIESTRPDLATECK
jgi:hypothetical protein